MNYNIDKLANDFGKDILKKYDKYKEEKEISNNIIRKINLSMSNACEDEVALLVSKVINKNKNENNKYKFLIDTYLSYKDEKNESQLYRPDIIIVKTYEKNKEIINEIVGIIEVKSQMGYCGILTPEIFEEKINNLNNTKISFDNEEYEELSESVKTYYKKMDIHEENKKKYINFKINKNLKVFIVNVMAKNHVDNVEGTIHFFKDNKSKIRFYNLFGPNEEDSKLWYNNLSSEYLYEKNKSTKSINLKNRTIPVPQEDGTIEKKKIDINDTLDNKIRETHGFKQFVDDIAEEFGK